MKKKQNKNYTLPLVASICVVSFIVMILALVSGERHEQAVFTPPSFDSAAQIGIPTVPDGLGYSELDTQAYKVSVCGEIITNGNSADIWLTNPESNEVWLKLRVLDSKGNILGETGLIRPGEYVQSVALGQIPKSGTQIVLKLMAYEPETYYSAGAVTLNTVIR